MQAMPPIVIDTRDATKMRKKKGEGKKWVTEQQGKHFCLCGCCQTIKIQIHHSSRGIPRFIDGHTSRVNNPMAGRDGNKNPNYKQGRYTAKNGYIWILIPGPGRSQYVLEHRLVMERFLGRKLQVTEIIHHRNGIKWDNRLENLQILSNSDHSKHHAQERRQKRCNPCLQ